MARLKAGMRVRSAVCSTEVMVIAAPDEDIELRCGGAVMIAIGDKPPAGVSIDAGAAEGTALGKRYVNAAGNLELLCTKPGGGSLAAGGVRLAIKEAKPLPSSD